MLKTVANITIKFSDIFINMKMSFSLKFHFSGDAPLKRGISGKIALILLSGSLQSTQYNTTTKT